MKPESQLGTWVLAGVTLLVLLLSLPASLSDAFDRGGIYLFSQAFIEDLPKRLLGPGRFRFILQPAIAVILGVLNGLADARAGRPPFLYGILFHREARSGLLRSGFQTTVRLVLMGILMDSIFQWLILGISHPGAAILVGPILVGAPYTIARALVNRFAAPPKTG